MMMMINNVIGNYMMYFNFKIKFTWRCRDDAKRRQTTLVTMKTELSNTLFLVKGRLKKWIDLIYYY